MAFWILLLKQVKCSQNRKINQLPAFVNITSVPYKLGHRKTINYKRQSLKVYFSGKIIWCQYVVCKRSRRWRNNMCFFKGCCEVNGTAVYAVCGGLSHLTKYDFLNIVKTNIPLRFKENMINFYFHYFNCSFTRSNSEIH